VLTVADNGPGVPADLRTSIFDPFFTTKAVGRGTGLGLSISHKIAQEHGGTLALCDTPDSGACFRLTLPAAEAP
jgi:two-component system sensor histidine kinase HupT/HoxJ